MSTLNHIITLHTLNMHLNLHLSKLITKKQSITVLHLYIIYYLVTQQLQCEASILFYPSLHCTSHSKTYPNSKESSSIYNTMIQNLITKHKHATCKMGMAELNSPSGSG